MSLLSFQDPLALLTKGFLLPASFLLTKSLLAASRQWKLLVMVICFRFRGMTVATFVLFVVFRRGPRLEEARGLHDAWPQDVSPRQSSRAVAFVVFSVGVFGRRGTILVAGVIKGGSVLVFKGDTATARSGAIPNHVSASIAGLGEAVDVVLMPVGNRLLVLILPATRIRGGIGVNIALPLARRTAIVDQAKPSAKGKVHEVIVGESDAPASARRGEHFNTATSMTAMGRKTLVDLRSTGTATIGRRPGMVIILVLTILSTAMFTAFRAV